MMCNTVELADRDSGQGSFKAQVFLIHKVREMFTKMHKGSSSLLSPQPSEVHPHSLSLLFCLYYDLCLSHPVLTSFSTKWKHLFVVAALIRGLRHRISSSTHVFHSYFLQEKRKKKKIWFRKKNIFVILTYL